MMMRIYDDQEDCQRTFTYTKIPTPYQPPKTVKPKASYFAIIRFPIEHKLRKPRAPSSWQMK